MADHDNLDAVELASAYLDGEATADERARVEGDPALLAEVERLRRVRDAVATTASAPAAQRDAAINAALATFDGLQVDAPSPPNVVPMASRRKARWMQGLTAAAAAIVLVLGGIVIVNRGGDDDSADEMRQAGATSPAVIAPIDTAEAEQDAAEEPLATPPNEMMAAEVAPTTPTAAAATTAIAMDAAAAPAPVGEPDVLRDEADLASFAASLDVAPPPLDDVVADCEAGTRTGPPDAMFEDDDGTVIEVAVSSMDDGYAAVALDDCTIVLRTP
jgi:hypothetical protein